MVELLQNQKGGFTKIVIVDNLENSSVKVLERIGEITNTQAGTDFFFEEADLRDVVKLESIFTKHAPVHSVIHFAGLKAVGVSVSKPLLYYENNVGGTISLL
jgi:UDP-glucose 4-epimerase